MRQLTPKTMRLTDFTRQMSGSFFKFATKVVGKGPNVLFPVYDKTLKIDDRLSTRLRYILSKIVRRMLEGDHSSCLDLVPPAAVRGMTTLQEAAFTKTVSIPGLKVPKKDISRNQKSWKPVVLKIRSLRPVAELSDNDPLKESHSLILLDPQKLNGEVLTEGQLETLHKLGLDVKKPEEFEVKLGYENWTVADVLRAVLPSEVDNVTSYTQVGHIAHLNLKPETLPFKKLIGQVIIDKVPSVKTVVNKLNTIDNTYRNFSMELLAGEDNFVTQTKEHNCVFELDFSKVYWNSRLSTEHDRIVKSIPKGSLVYDVFAGIGPFAIPLAKKKHCTVLANDLNPASFEALNKNVKLNKINEGCITTWNLDGKDFIFSVVKNRLEEQIKDYFTKVNLQDMNNCCSDDSKRGLDVNDKSEKGEGDNGESHEEPTQDSNDNHVASSYVIMNLPAIAVEFLGAFNSLLKESTLAYPALKENPAILTPLLPQVFCYAFSPKGDIDTELKLRVEKHLGEPVPDDYTARLVRNVAPNKEMMCISFKLWPRLLLGLSPDQADSQCCVIDSDSENIDAGSKRSALCQDDLSTSKKMRTSPDTSISEIN